MGKHGKKYEKALEKIDKDKRYELEEAIQLVIENTFTNFDESVDAALRLGVDPRHADQMVRRVAGVRSTVGIAGRSLVFNANASNFGALYVMLDEFDKRDTVDLSADAIAQTLRNEFA